MRSQVRVIGASTAALACLVFLAVPAAAGGSSPSEGAVDEKSPAEQPEELEADTTETTATTSPLDTMLDADARAPEPGPVPTSEAPKPSPASVVAIGSPLFLLAPGAPASDPVVTLATTPVVTVAPSDGLVHGDEVTVTGSGFTPNATIGLTQCRADATSSAGCDISTLHYTTADASGAWSTPFTVRRVLFASGGPFDCTTAPGCIVGGANVASPGYSEAAVAPIEFDATVPPPPPPEISVDPSTALLHLQGVTVQGSNWTPNATIGITQCRADATSVSGCDLSTLHHASADASGDWSTTFTVHRVVYTLDGRFDCATPPGCVLGAGNIASPGYAERAAAPIAFDATVPPPPPPEISVDPSTSLLHLQPVDIEGSGFRPNTPLFLAQCLEGTSECNFSTAFGVTDGSGAFTITDFRVQRVVGTQGAEITDCRDATCVLRVQGFGFAGGVEATLSFADVPLPPPPQVTVTPSTGLASSQSVTVSGTGYRAGLTINLVQCTRESTFFVFDCIFGPVLQAGSDGSFETTMTVSRFIRSFGGSIDCAQPGRCIVAAFSYDDVLSTAGTPIGFDPEPPEPPVVGAAQVAGTSEASGSDTLPVTGADSQVLVGAGFLAFALGVALVAVTRPHRRRRLAR